MSSESFSSSIPSVTLTDNAALRVAYLAAKEPVPGAMLRIAVLGGGCSGFQYDYQFVREREATDVVIEKMGAVVLIDDTSLPLLAGATLDYVETLESAMFVITNPKATGRCGCGNSFAV